MKTERCLISRFCSLIFLAFLSLNLNAQPTSDGYVFPIRPGEQNYLAGTMGELRTSHFHGGLDIKTGGRIGLPVHATADGYISRIQVSTGGYGHVLYLTHDDGNISVYGHLNRFEKGLESYLRYKQYEQEAYEIRVFPQEDLFRFSKGEVIAYSGNTGSSSGPHLHFEIRDGNHRFLNPMDFGFTEVKDNIPPILKSIAFVTRDQNARVNDAFGRFTFDILKVNNKYTTRQPIKLEGNIGIETYFYDNQNGSWSRNGIPETVLKVNEDTVYHSLKNQMSFGLNRNILVHYDFATYTRNRRKYTKLYLDDGNDLNIYLTSQKGIYFDNENHDLALFFRDDLNNLSIFETKVNNRRIVYPETPPIKNFDILGNTLQYVSEDSLTSIHIGYNTIQNRPYISRKNKNFFLWDLRKGLPDSICAHDKTLYPDFFVAIPSTEQFSFYNGDFDLKCFQKSLFDTLYLRFDKYIDSTRNLEVFAFKNYQNPLKGNVEITLKPQKKYGEKSAVYEVNSSRISYVGGEKNYDGSFTFKTRNFAYYTISTDTVPPIITPVNWSPNNLKMAIKDEHSGIKSFRATINGEFLLMRFEAKRNLLMALPKNESEPLSGEFLLVIEDMLGNTKELKRTL